eukprot:CAMPEP_0184703454 /NCGR_PEP_ID=MMETSP0313-20130426/27860_1 /TAXON_ID=2792 /ORGANISM="Porphyridium aerugineum, Strain SAG 1380-2" /LENGTH=42 /DNA_ID= /DNA_START= /DNA_END= /DNA_ORIENTATION=
MRTNTLGSEPAEAIGPSKEESVVDMRLAGTKRNHRSELAGHG